MIPPVIPKKVINCQNNNDTDKCLLEQKTISVSNTLFRNERFMLNQISKQNVSNFRTYLNLYLNQDSGLSILRENLDLLCSDVFVSYSNLLLNWRGFINYFGKNWICSDNERLCSYSNLHLDQVYQPVLQIHQYIKS